MKADANDSLARYRIRIAAIHRELGIEPGHAEQRGLTLEAESADLVDAGADIFSRPVLMDAQAHRAWQAMSSEALTQGIELQLVSAYRSADYQKGLFLKKLSGGARLQDILRVNAPPGYSEHHSGQALDLHCPGVQCLTEAFEDSSAYAWLCEHAALFGFSLSFPRDNPAGFLYEPWHWRFRPQT